MPLIFAATVVIISLALGHDGSFHAGSTDAGAPANILLANVLDVAHAESDGQALTLAAVGNMTDTDTDDLVLDGAAGVDTFAIGSETYAIVASQYENGVQLINVSDPSTPVAAGNLTDTDDLVLSNAVGVSTFVINSETYAIVASQYENGVQLINVSDPSTPVAAGNLTDTDDLVLAGSFGVDTFAIGSETYAIVAAQDENGVQLINVSDPSTPVAAGNLTDTDEYYLYIPYGVVTFTIEPKTYAIVTVNDGVMLMDISDPSDPAIVSKMIDTDDTVLYRAYGADTFTADSELHAITTSQYEYGVQLMGISDPSAPMVAGNLTSSTGAVLDEIRNVDTFAIGSKPYAIVTVSPGRQADNGVQIIDISDPSAPMVAGNLTDTDGLVLDGAAGVDTFAIGSETYAIVTASIDSGVQIIQIISVPTVTLNGPNPLEVGQFGTYRDPGAACTDIQDGNIAVNVSSNPVDTTVAKSYDVTYTCTDSDGNAGTATRTVTVTPDTMPPELQSVTYNPRAGTLALTFSEIIKEQPDYASMHVRDEGDSTVDITLEQAASKNHDGDRITATLTPEQKEQFANLDSPRFEIGAGAVLDRADNPIDAVTDMSIGIQNSRSNPGSPPPIVDLGALQRSDLVEIPNDVLEIHSTYDTHTPLMPVTANGSYNFPLVIRQSEPGLPSFIHVDDDEFDFPLVIDGSRYLLGGVFNTLQAHRVVAGQTTEIIFTVYSHNDLAHFALYLNLQGQDTKHSESDTYAIYDNGDTVHVADPHDYISHATVTVTQQDKQQPEKKTVHIAIEFKEPMGMTNMVAYLWDVERKAVQIKIINALDVVPEPVLPSAVDPEAGAPGSGFAANPEAGAPDGSADDTALPGTTHAEDEQVLQLIRMWSGFEPEYVTDAQLIEFLGLDGYRGASIPGWMMTELGVLAAKNLVTVEEFKTALEYVLDNT